MKPPGQGWVFYCQEVFCLFQAVLPAMGMALGLVAAAARAQGAVVINEIMYHPPDDLDQLQYVELFNRGAESVDLSGWSFTKGIHFTFPAPTALAPGACLVVCADRKVFAKHYGTEPVALGDFTGTLSHRGEKLELSNAAGQVVDELKYADTDPWPTGPDGYSASLERICPLESGQAAPNWAGSRLRNAGQPGGTPGRQNDNFSSNSPPVIAHAQFKTPLPGQELTVSAEVSDEDGVRSVSLFYCAMQAREHVAQARDRSPEREVAMRPAGDAGRFQGVIPGQPESTLVRFRIRAVDGAGQTRWLPAPQEPRPAFSCSTYVNTNTARIPFAFVLSGPAAAPPLSARAGRRPPRERRSMSEEQARGESTFVYLPPEGGEALTFDYVQVRPRPGGFKVHFQKDRPWHGMTGINIIFESPPRCAMAEPLAYELYRLADVPAPLTEHVRVWYDGRPLGYRLLIEQPNKAFLARNQRGDAGNLYKCLWQGHGLVGQHEKKTRPASGCQDLIALHSGLTKSAGAAQWACIQEHFNVEEFAGYYAVNMCIQNWDGFFNNHFLYHLPGDAGKWEVYPWDEDKTWGFFDGAAPPYRWYEMPLTLGMKGDPSRHGPWWRGPGWFSGPLLANAQFRSRFLDRLEQLCAGPFTPEKFGPIIDALERRLEPEVAVRAQARGEDPRRALQAFHTDIQSFRDQVKYRRQYLLKELPSARKWLDRAPTDPSPAARAEVPSRRQEGPLAGLARQLFRAWLLCAGVGVGTAVVVVFLHLNRR
jgi:hypothetical protein